MSLKSFYILLLLFLNLKSVSQYINTDDTYQPALSVEWFYRYCVYLLVR